MKTDILKWIWRGTLIYCNEANARLFGYSPAELIGRNNREYTDPENAKKVYEIFNQVYQTCSPQKGFVCELVDRNGSTHIVEPRSPSSGIPIIKRSVSEGFSGILPGKDRPKRP